MLVGIRFFCGIIDKKFIMKFTKKEVELIRKNSTLSSSKIAELIFSKLGIKRSSRTIRKKVQKLGLRLKPEEELPPEDLVARDIQLLNLKTQYGTTNKKYKVVLKENERLMRELEIALAIDGKITTNKIKSKVSSGNSEAVAVVLASDWHVEELVNPDKVNQRNEYNLTIAKQRAENFFRSVKRLLEIQQTAVKIDTLILWLGGDFISSNIHEELLENTALRPIEAILFAENLIASGIQFLLENTNVNLVIPCAIGNHSRITKRVHYSSEQGNSLEYLLYKHLEKYFDGKKRVDFRISKGYHQYIEVYPNFVIRFHHGHALRFGGGIGGLYIPTRKAIAQWQKNIHADLDCFGHFHNFKMDGDLFVCNGSLIGWNAFANQIKADYEKPRQVFFLVDKKRGKTMCTPITI